MSTEKPWEGRDVLSMSMGQRMAIPAQHAVRSQFQNLKFENFQFLDFLAITSDAAAKVG